MVSVLFLCTGNICRSPTAEAVFRQRIKASNYADSVRYDSAGTHGYHIGERPDHRSIAMAEKHGVPMDGLYARKLAAEDFSKFDYIVAMDAGHADFARNAANGQGRAKIRLLLDGHPEYDGMDVPDPYYGSMADFKQTYDLIVSGIDHFMSQILVK